LEGHKCREQNKADVKEEITKEWKTTFDSLVTMVENTKDKTKTIVNQGWEKHVQCEKDHPCCQTSYQVAYNKHVQIVTTRQKIQELQGYWESLYNREKTIETDCPAPEYGPYECAAKAGTCPDGGVRDDLCECEFPLEPICPKTPCANGMMRDIVTCACPYVNVRVEETGSETEVVTESETNTEVVTDSETNTEVVTDSETITESSTVYEVNGQEMSEEEYNEYMANFNSGATNVETSTETSTEQIFTVNGEEVSEAEFNAAQEQPFE